MKSYYSSVGMGVLCELVGKTRQAFYKSRSKKERLLFDASIIIGLVIRERQTAKRVGTRRLLLILEVELLTHNIKIGRQRFNEILRDNDLLIKRRKRKPKLTDSRHKLPLFANKARSLSINCSEQLWVSDITYIKVRDVFCYLILITDAYSRKVMGYNFARTMDTAFCLEALDQALELRSYPERELMHHTDRGTQYCSFDYTDKLKLSNIIISMTERGDPLENPLAERMNRTFKDVFGLDENFGTYQKAQQQIDKSVAYYNTRLPHSSIDYLTPQDAHHRRGHLKKHWTYYWRAVQDESVEINAYTPI